MNVARRRAVRAVISALASGGLTAASIGAGLPATALAAGSETTTTPASEGTTTTPSAGPESGTSTTITPVQAATPTATVPASTTPAPNAPAPASKPAEVPAVVIQRRQKTTKSTHATPTTTPTTSKSKSKGETANNNVALSPQLIAAQAAALASSQASIQALGFYRIPLFLLPIYKAAAVQYGVPWQILAAVNEIETDYGGDLSVSSAGAVGWMQFMPATWLQYGVDALNAGYADPYNPVDAIFAAARYLRAAGAATNLHAAILAYNHSEEYASSVLLRAKLISSYPRSVIDTLTGLIDGRLPVTGGRLAWSAPPGASATSATAGATQLGAPGAAAGAASGTTAAAGTGAEGAASTQGAPAAGTPGSSAAPSPTAALAKVKSTPAQLDQLTSTANARVVAVQDGRVVKLGHSKALGRYLVLRDVYGDVFTYGDLGSIARTYTLPKAAANSARAPVVRAASSHDPTPARAASAGFQSPVTLTVKTPKKKKKPASSSLQAGAVSIPQAGDESTPAGMGRVRLFAHPGNPDARAAAVVAAAARLREQRAAGRLPLKAGAVVASGTVLGTVSVVRGLPGGHLRFAIRPAGDASTIDPGPVLNNWAQLQSALHPQGAKASDPLLGATASDVFLLSKPQLQRAVLSDPGISVYACGRHDIAAGLIDRRILATLAFLSRSGLKPTVSALRCGQSPVTATGATSAAYQGNAVEITAINGTPIAGHQGAGSITDLTLRTLLTLPSEFVPASIASLMRYPGAPSTHASDAFSNRVRLEFRAERKAVALSPSAAGAAAHSAHKGKLAAVPLVRTATLTAQEWSQLIGRIAALPAPKVGHKPSSAAIADPKRP